MSHSCLTFNSMLKGYYSEMIMNQTLEKKSTLCLSLSFKKGIVICNLKIISIKFRYLTFNFDTKFRIYI